MDSRKTPRIRIRMVFLGATIIFSVGASAFYLGVQNRIALLAIAIATALILVLAGRVRVR
jgi:hypothetical protein